MPPVVPNRQLLGSINIGNTAGGMNWPGAGFDPETGIFYTQAAQLRTSPSARYDEEEFAKVKPEKSRATRHAALGSRTELRSASRRSPAARRRAGWRVGRRRSASRWRRRTPALAEGLDGLPIVKPPYGVMAAIDLNNRAS